jgi:hypothetical protein
MSKNDTEAGRGSPDEGGNRGLLGTTRRKFVATGSATWASVSLAGCLGGGDDEGQEDETPRYVVTDEIVAGSDGIPEAAGDLVSAGRGQRSFVPGMQAVFKIGIWDPETGDIVSDNTITDATVTLGSGEEIELEFASTEREWSGTWTIPEDYEPGTVEYEVQVSNGAEFTEVGVAENTLEVIEFDPQVANYVVTIDTITHDDQAGGWVQGCAPQHQYTADQAVGFHVGIYDGSNGELVTDEVVDSAQVVFNNIDADPVPLSYDNPEDGEPLWSATWRGIPEGYTGTIEFEVQVSNEDEEFYNVGIESGTIQVIEEPNVGQQANNYVVTVDTISIADRAPETGGGYVQSCWPQTNFATDMAVGFHVGIYDGTNGEMVGTDTIDEATISFTFIPSEGDSEQDLGTESLTYDNPDDGEPLWALTWRGTPDEPGRVDYEVQLTVDGEFQEVGVEYGSIQFISPPDL